MENPRTPEVLARPQGYEAFLVENIEALRDNQTEVLNAEGSEEEKLARIEQLIEDYLQAHDPEGDIDHMKAILRELSANKIDAVGWQYGDWIDKENKKLGPTGRDFAARVQVNLYGKRMDYEPYVFSAPGVDESGAADDERTVEIIETELNSARDAWSSVQAKRQGKAIDRPVNGSEHLQSAYQGLVNELGIRTLSEELDNEAMSEEDKARRVVQYILEEQSKLRKQTTEKLQGTKVGKFVEWMNRGGRIARLAKGVLLGVGAGAAGGVIAFAGAGLAVGVGVTAAAAGVATVASRFARGYSTHDKRGMGTVEQQVDDIDKRQAVRAVQGNTAINLERKLQAATAVTDRVFERDTKEEQHKRRKAIAWGATSIALGAGAGFVLGELGAQAASWGPSHTQSVPAGAATAGVDTHTGTPHHFDWTPDDDSLPSSGLENTQATPHHLDWSPNDDNLPYNTTETPYRPGWTPGDHNLETLTPQPGTVDPLPVQPDVSPAPVIDTEPILNDEFMVGKGSGLIRELSEFAAANDQKLDLIESGKLHQHLLRVFGDDYINIAGGSDIYIEHGDVRLARPGMATWETGVAEEVKSWMSARGLWK